MIKNRHFIQRRKYVNRLTKWVDDRARLDPELYDRLFHELQNAQAAGGNSDDKESLAAVVQIVICSWIVGRKVGQDWLAVALLSMEDENQRRALHHDFAVAWERERLRPTPFNEPLQCMMHLLSSGR